MDFLEAIECELHIAAVIQPLWGFWWSLAKNADEITVAVKPVPNGLVICAHSRRRVTAGLTIGEELRGFALKALLLWLMGTTLADGGVALDVQLLETAIKI